MNKKKLVGYVSDKTMITAKDAGIIVDVVFDGIKEALEDEEQVKLREFGTFFVQHKKARKAYSPIDGSPIAVPPRNSIKFRASKHLNEKVN